MTEPNITQEELQEELEKGKTFKQIAFEYGYGDTSRRLSDKVRSLGYKKNQQLSLRSDGGSNFYIASNSIQEALSNADLDTDQELFFEHEVTDSGEIVIKPTSRMWSRKQGDDEG